MWIDLKNLNNLKCDGCRFRHYKCHSHCSYSLERDKLFDRIRKERELTSELNAYDKEAKRRMKRTRSTNGIHI